MSAHVLVCSMLFLSALILSSALSSSLDSKSDPLALRASFQNWADNISQKALSDIYQVIQPPVALEWDTTIFYSSEDFQIIKKAFQMKLLEKQIELLENDSTVKVPHTYLNLSFVQMEWSKEIALRIRIQYQGQTRYYISLTPIQSDEFKPSAISQVMQKSTQAIDLNWQQSEGKSLTSIAFPSIHLQDKTPDPDRYYGTVLAAEISKTLPFVLDEAQNSAKLTGEITCALKNLAHPNRRCNQINLSLDLTDPQGNPIWSGSFNAEAEETNTNARLRYLENQIADNQTQALIIGCLGLPLTTAGIVIWYDNYKARMNKLNEGSLPSSSGSGINLSIGEYVGIGMSAIGGAGLIYAGHAVFVAADFNAERNELLKTGNKPQ